MVGPCVTYVRQTACLQSIELDIDRVDPLAAPGEQGLVVVSRRIELLAASGPHPEPLRSPVAGW